jgi:starch synthase
METFSFPSVCLICLTRRGGLVNYHLRLTNALAAYTRVSTIISHTAPSQYLNPSVAFQTIDIGDHGARSTLFRLPVGLLRLYKAIQSLHADIYHITSDQEWNLFLGLLLRAMGKRIIYTVHDPVPHLGAPWHNVFLEKLFRYLPHAYIVLSQHSLRLMTSQRIPQAKLALASISDLFIREIDPVPQKEKIILFQGRLEPYKGLDVLLDAAKVLADYPDWKLVIAGTGSITPNVLPHPQIEFLHRFISDDELVDLYRRSAFIVAPYIEATQSTIPVMAMVAARPVIASNVGGLPEYVTHEQTGLLVPPGDAHALANAMRRLMENAELRQRLGENALRVYRSELGWGRAARQHLEGYRKALPPARSGR